MLQTPALADAEPRPRRPRARAERVGMFGSGYRVVVEDRCLAFETWDVRWLKEIIRHCERTFASKVEVIGPW